MQKTNIEWANSSWNPISGCYNDCFFCYARRTANRFKGCDSSPSGETSEPIVELDRRLKVTNKDGVTRGAAYPVGFTPTFHRYRLDDLKTKKFGETIFVGSMGDMFGPWIPDDWLSEVFKACLDSPEHRYLFLTKYPGRYVELDLEGLLPQQDNFWYGTTVNNPDMPYMWSDIYNTFLSIEPLLAPFGKADIESLLAPFGKAYTEAKLGSNDWIIIGAMTGPGSEEHQPKREWIVDLVSEAKKADVPVFMKDSLIPIWGDDIITQFPWETKKENDNDR